MLLICLYLSRCNLVSVKKDTPHYKLMVLLEQELPEASRRDKIDELGEF